MMQFSLTSFFGAFKSAPRPELDQIALHRCCECDRVRDDFSKYDAKEVPDDLLHYHGDSIPLLSPIAFRYFLPRYVEFTYNNPDANATDNLLYNLSPDDKNSEFWKGRCDSFTKQEKQVIIQYLQYRRTLPDAEFDEEYIGPGIEYWKSL